MLHIYLILQFINFAQIGFSLVHCTLWYSSVFILQLVTEGSNMQICKQYASLERHETSHPSWSGTGSWPIKNGHFRAWTARSNKPCFACTIMQTKNFHFLRFFVFWLFECLPFWGHFEPFLALSCYLCLP